MSVINKEPFIKKVLKTLTEQELKSLQNLIDGKGDRTYLKRTMNPAINEGRVHITTSDRGVHLCNLQLEFSLFNGYLIYNNFFCVLIYFTDAQVLGMFNIDVAKTKLATVDEALSVVELRSALDDFLIEAGELGELVEIKEVENLPAEGEEDTIYLSDSNIVNPTEGPVNVPKPLATDVGKVLEATADGNYRLGPTIEGAIQADKDIISQIEVEYDDGYTYFTFPKGVMPLSITLNTHRLFFKDGNDVVGENGQTVEGYELDDKVLEDGYFVISFVGDVSEQVINGLTYIQFNGDARFIENTYNLFFPASGGTKLYKHKLSIFNVGANGIISLSDTPITTAVQIYNDIRSTNILKMLIGIAGSGYVVAFSTFSAGKYYLNYYDNSGTVQSVEIPSSVFTDTVTEL